MTELEKQLLSALEQL
ncbi:MULTISPECIES: MbeD/MobD family mobilization/exclusion protein, partial [Enterobacterales]|nr:hypothetical protein [Escherichia coli]